MIPKIDEKCKCFFKFFSNFQNYIAILALKQYNDSN